MRNHAHLAITHLKTSSHALSLNAEGRLQEQELDIKFHRIWDEHTSFLSVHDEICVCRKPALYRKRVYIPHSCICNQPMWLLLVVGRSL